MKKWIDKTMLGKFGNVSPKDLDLIPITDDLNEVIKIINEAYQKPLVFDWTAIRLFSRTKLMKISRG